MQSKQNARKSIQVNKKSDLLKMVKEKAQETGIQTNLNTRSKISDIRSYLNMEKSKLKYDFNEETNKGYNSVN